MVLADGARAAVAPNGLAGAREALAREWRAASPVNPDEVVTFYKNSTRLPEELSAWHKTPARKQWTDAVLYVARSIEPKLAVDIGCGLGNELRALAYEANVETVVGVEPNDSMRRTVEHTHGFACHESVDDASQVIADADLILCLDVLEHVVDPEAFLTKIAMTAKLGAVLVEATATFDTDTPLHLKANYGWHPGRVLEQAGWDLTGFEATPGQEVPSATALSTGRLRAWQRRATSAPPRAGVLACMYRAYSVATSNSVLALIAGQWRVREDEHWRVATKTGDGLVDRARAITVSRWYRETADDVFLMIDDDISFAPEAAELVVEQCRRTEAIVCAAYPVRDGTHLALRQYPGELIFGEDAPLQRIEFAATGFMAVHRKVVDALVADAQLCHEDESWSFWPLFTPFIMELPNGLHMYLSEDWAFSARARRAGFEVYVDGRVRIKHQAVFQLDVFNMGAFARLGKEESNGR